MSTNPFDYLNAINNTKKNVLVNDKDYNAFIVNRGLSYFPDTILYANEMNINHQIDSRLQFDFLINTIRKRKRFSKWNKTTESSDIDALKAYYGYSNEKARNVLPLLSMDELNIIKEKVNHGGLSRRAR
jgi:hypothetical protein